MTVCTKEHVYVITAKSDQKHPLFTQNSPEFMRLRVAAKLKLTLTKLCKFQAYVLNVMVNQFIGLLFIWSETILTVRKCSDRSFLHWVNALFIVVSGVQGFIH